MRREVASTDEWNSHRRKVSWAHVRNTSADGFVWSGDVAFGGEGGRIRDEPKRHPIREPGRKNSGDCLNIIENLTIECYALRLCVTIRKEIIRLQQNISRIEAGIEVLRGMEAT